MYLHKSKYVVAFGCKEKYYPCPEYGREESSETRP